MNFVALVVFTTSHGWSNELQLVFQHGEPVKSQDEFWEGRVEHASWVDDEFVVFFSRGKVSCLSTKSGEIQWTGENMGRIFSWSVSRATKRLAIQDENLQLFVIDCMTGSVIFQPSSERLGEIIGQTYAWAGAIAFMPTDGRLILETAGSTFGRHAYVIDSNYSKLEASFEIDANPRSISISPDGKRAATIADEDVLSVREILENYEVFFRGKRIHEDRAFRTSIDAPFFSHFRDSGGEILVYSRDESWSTGTVTVHNLATETSTTFSGRNGHIELDVSFRTKRLAITGTSKELALVDFNGEVVASVKHATWNRNSSVEFSPSEDRILVGSWDNTVSVFSIVETDDVPEGLEGSAPVDHTSGNGLHLEQRQSMKPWRGKWRGKEHLHAPQAGPGAIGCRC